MTIVGEHGRSRSELRETDRRFAGMCKV
jgi:hypothetical protein